LRHRKSILQHDDIADPERVARVRATDRNADVARTVSLLEGDAWALLQQVLDREGGLVLDALAAESGDGLSRGFGRAPGPASDAAAPSAAAVPWGGTIGMDVAGRGTITRRATVVSRGSKSGSPFHKKPKWHSWNGFRYDMHGNGMGVFYWIGDCRISSG
jgi:hypothetical protein